jgi:hypothetical protein
MPRPQIQQLKVIRPRRSANDAFPVPRVIKRVPADFWNETRGRDRLAYLQVVFFVRCRRDATKEQRLSQPRPDGPEVNGRLFKTVLMTRSGAVAISQDLIQRSQRGTKPSLKRPTIS